MEGSRASGLSETIWPGSALAGIGQRQQQLVGAEVGRDDAARRLGAGEAKRADDGDKGEHMAHLQQWRENDACPQ